LGAQGLANRQAVHVSGMVGGHDDATTRSSVTTKAASEMTLRWVARPGAAAPGSMHVRKRGQAR